MQLVDPLKLGKLLWPKVTFSKEQIDIIYSVWDDDETVVPAANMMGKDFVSAFIVLMFFMTRSPCRIVTTSAKEDHLRVLWGEIGNFINTSELALDSIKGGDLIVNQKELRKLVNGEVEKISYVIGMVASEDRVAAMQGHHVAKTGDGIPRTLFVSDESSSVPDSYYKMCDTWADRKLIIGNTWPCDNFFKHAVKGKPGTKDRGGDIARPSGKGFHRRIIKIKAVDSPNVRRALKQIEQGQEPDNKVVVPGIKTYADYQKNLLMWDEIQKTVCLEAEWYEGGELYMFPKDWFDVAWQQHNELVQTKAFRKVKTIGVDSAEGNDNSAWALCDEHGLIELLSEKTKDTTLVVKRTLGLMREHNVDPQNILFDRGGGGKQHADRMREMGFNVRTIAFGESAIPDKKRRGVVSQLKQRIDENEQRYAYKNRRAEMYGILRQRMNPNNGRVFALPAKYNCLWDQLTPIPLTYDGEGRMVLPPKRKQDKDSNVVTLIDLIGHSPDEADALVLGVYGLEKKAYRQHAGSAAVRS